MLKLNFNLRHQAITLSNPGTVVATDSKNYLVANFNFISDDWEYPLTAVFTSDVEKIPYTILVGQSEELEENECFIPWEVLQSSGNVYVSVFCGDLHTTNTVKFKVVKSGYTEGEIPPPPTPTIYEQILQALDSKQPMLTAGENITIDENNVISSAGGGTSNYNDLSNIPTITIENETSDLNGSLNFYFSSFKKTLFGTHGIDLDDRVFQTLSDVYYTARYNFSQINDSYYRTGVFQIAVSNIDNIPNEFSNYSLQNAFFIYHFVRSKNVVAPIIRIVCYRTPLSEIKMYLQIATLNENGVVSNASDWLDIAEPTQIVSGVVNQNGTITFTNADGTTFTTSGSSVIGADGFSPSATVQQTASGATITVTDKNGTTTANIANGQDGNDYILTAQDKDDIADIVLAEFTGSIVNGELNTR